MVLKKRKQKYSETQKKYLRQELKRKAKRKQQLGVVELRQKGRGWFPKITRKAFNKLKKRQDTGVYPFAFIVDKALSTQNSVTFHVKKGAGTKKTGTEIRFGARTKTGTLLEGHGTFLINFETKTIQKIGMVDTGIE